MVHLQGGTPAGLWEGASVPLQARGFLMAAGLPRGWDPRRMGRSHDVFWGPSLEVTDPHFCHILLVTQTNSDSVWKEATQWRFGRWDRRGHMEAGCPVFPSHGPHPSASATLTQPGSVLQSPAAEDPEEVTYAQLDQRALTRRAARAESPQPTEPTADSSMYAALPPH